MDPKHGIWLWIYLIVIIGLVLFAGLMSGLTLGLMSLGLVDLEVLQKSGTPEDRKHAEKIMPVVKNQHLLLCTLLIGNALAMETLPIFLDGLLSPWGAILISVTLILMFGEIIPQAICSRYGLTVGATMAPLVRVLVFAFFPISYPISKLLDFLLGKGHVALFRRAELKTLVGMHANEAGKGGELTHDETTIIAGALELTEKTAKDAMTPISQAFCIDINTKLDMETINLIMAKGHSRIPVYSGSPINIIGLILVKNLLAIRPEDKVLVRNVTIRKIPRVAENIPLYDILNEFQKGHSHMEAVVKYKNEKLHHENRSTDFKALLERRMNHRILASKSSLDMEAVNKNIPALGSLTSFSHGSSRLVYKGDGDDASTENGHIADRLRKRDRSKIEHILEISEESVPSMPQDEEVVGIITMEDVIEELLQEEIFDETDEYIDLHNKIKVNMLLSARSASLRTAASVTNSSLPMN